MALNGRFVGGVEVLRDGTELHLVSFGLADAELRLAGYDDPAFAALKAEYADVLGGAPPGLPPERGMELVIETGDAPMPRSRPVKRLSEGGLAELRTLLFDRLDLGRGESNTRRRDKRRRWWARKPDGTWRICYVSRAALAACSTLSLYRHGAGGCSGWTASHDGRWVRHDPESRGPPAPPVKR